MTSSASTGHVASFGEIKILDVRDLDLAIPSIRITRADRENFGCRYGCGILEMTRR